MNKQQVELFHTLLQLRSRAVGALVIASELAKVQNRSINSTLAELFAHAPRPGTKGFSNAEISATWALFDELRATTRAVLPVVQQRSLADHDLPDNPDNWIPEG